MRNILSTFIIVISFFSLSSKPNPLKIGFQQSKKIIEKKSHKTAKEENKSEKPEELQPQELTESDKKALALYEAYKTKNKKEIQEALKKYGVEWQIFYILNKVGKDASEVLEKVVQVAYDNNDELEVIQAIIKEKNRIDGPWVKQNEMMTFGIIFWTGFYTGAGLMYHSLSK